MGHWGPHDGELLEQARIEVEIAVDYHRRAQTAVTFAPEAADRARHDAYYLDMQWNNEVWLAASA